MLSAKLSRKHFCVVPRTSLLGDGSYFMECILSLDANIFGDFLVGYQNLSLSLRCRSPLMLILIVMSRVIGLDTT